MKLTNEMLRLYAVTDRRFLRGQSLTEQAERALAGGAGMIQLREKEMDEAALLRGAADMAKLCHRYGAPLIINDNVHVAMLSGADGVHLGQNDMRPQDARRLLGRDMIIGVTAKTIDQALAAQSAGADYLGSGAVFGTSTKPDAKPMSMDLLRSICAAVSIPVVAIGGIDRGNILSLAGTGVAGAAIVSGIFGAKDIEAECRMLRAAAEMIAAK